MNSVLFIAVSEASKVVAKLVPSPGSTSTYFATSRSRPLLNPTSSEKMASLTLRRANWCIQISRSSRTFAVSFTTSLGPRSQATRRLPHGTTSSFRSSGQKAYDRDTTSLRAPFTSSTQSRAQQTTDSTPKSSVRYAAPPKPTYNNASSLPSNPSPPTTASQDLTEGLSDQPIVLDEGERQIDWARSFHGLSSEPFPKEAADTLLTPIPFDDVEIKPDGIIYLPEIKYRRVLNKAFGPGGWGLAPRGETIVTAKAVTREYALLAHGRYVSLTRCIYRLSSTKVCSEDSSPWLVAKWITSLPKAFPPRQKAANPTP